MRGSQQTGKFLEMEMPGYLTHLLRNLYNAKKQQLQLDTEKQTGSKLRKDYLKTFYCHPAYLTYIQNQFSSD